MCCEADTYGWESDIGRVEKEEFRLKNIYYKRDHSTCKGLCCRGARPLGVSTRTLK